MCRSFISRMDTVGTCIALVGSSIYSYAFIDWPFELFNPDNRSITDGFMQKTL